MAVLVFASFGLLQSGNAALAQENAMNAKYAQATHASIIKLMWGFHAYDYSDLDAVDNYVRVTECGLYQKYYNDEFEWRKIQQATVSYLQKYSDSVTNYYEIVQPVTIGRYDFDLQGFPITDTPELFNMTAMQITDGQDYGGKECGLPRVTDGKFSPIAIIKFKTPINLDFIRVPKALAEEFVKFSGGFEGKGESGKQVYFRFRIRIDRFSNFASIASVGNVLIFSGKLIQLDVFADQQMFLPLYSQSYED